MPRVYAYNPSTVVVAGVSPFLGHSREWKDILSEKKEKGKSVGTIHMLNFKGISINCLITRVPPGGPQKSNWNKTKTRKGARWFWYASTHRCESILGAGEEAHWLRNEHKLILLLQKPALNLVLSASLRWLPTDCLSSSRVSQCF